VNDGEDGDKLVITLPSIGAAFIIGTVAILSVLTSEMHLHGAFWDAMASFDINLARFAIAGLFRVVWAAALLHWRLGRVEARAVGVRRGGLHDAPGSQH
jgi:high-affinity nickel-transport protein